MVTKMKKPASTQAAGAHVGGSVKDSAQQIWQAGLGAFAKAQAEGTRAFEALVKEGTTLQRKTQAAAEEKLSEATSRMSNMATDISSKASGQWDKLETIFEERVAKALNKLGVPSAKDISALTARMDELNLSVQKLSGGAPAKAKPAAPRKAAAKKSPTAVAPKAVAPKAPAPKTPVPKTPALKTAAPMPEEPTAAKEVAKPAVKRRATRKTA
jgi:poly(hydroxyalkanoate) granule-associated protein